jgi:predicted ArsR family transcriptional regulator
MMTKQDAFNAAQFAYTTYDAMWAAMAQQMGKEQALALERSALESLGAAQGQMLKEQAGVDDVDVQTAYSLLTAAIATLGFETEVLETSSECVTFNTGPCPIYEAGRSLGWDHETIE